MVGTAGADGGQKLQRSSPKIRVRDGGEPTMGLVVGSIEDVSGKQ